MDSNQFDRVSRLFASRLSRRQAMQQGVAGLAGLGLAAAVTGSGAAQDATPTTTGGEKIPYLFVQSFEGGTIAPKAGDDGTFTVTLEHGLGQTIYFSDRPSRDVGAAPTDRFLQGLGFPDDNPPNAALVVDDGNGGTDIAVVELRNPAYDAAAHTATYDLTVLENWEDTTGLGFREAPANLANLPETLGASHLFIDDCSPDYVVCITGTDTKGSFGPMDFCYNYLVCMPCEPYWHTQPDRCSTTNYWTQECNASIDGCAGNACTAGYLADLLVCPSAGV